MLQVHIKQGVYNVLGSHMRIAVMMRMIVILGRKEDNMVVMRIV